MKTKPDKPGYWWQLGQSGIWNIFQVRQPEQWREGLYCEIELPELPLPKPHQFCLVLIRSGLQWLKRHPMGHALWLNRMEAELEPGGCLQEDWAPCPPIQCVVPHPYNDPEFERELREATKV